MLYEVITLLHLLAQLIACRSNIIYPLRGLLSLGVNILLKVYSYFYRIKVAHISLPNPSYNFV